MTTILLLTVLAQTTQIRDLRLTAVSPIPHTAGALLVEWSAVPGETRYASEYWAIQYSQSSQFIDAPIIRILAWAAPDRLATSHTIEGLGNGTWYVRVALQWGPDIYDIVADGQGVGEGWTPYGVAAVSNSYVSPELIIPPGPYTATALTLRWTDSEVIPTYELHVSRTVNFVSYDTYSLLRSENGIRALDLALEPAGLIYLRLRGVTDWGEVTGWTWAVLDYRPESIYRYYLPWIAQNDQVTTLISVGILNDSPRTRVSVGVRPPQTGSFTPQTWWLDLEAVQGQIFLEPVGDLFPFTSQSLCATVESDAPIALTVYYDAALFGDQPIYQPVTIPEGTTAKWLIPSIRADAYHSSVAVVSNHSETVSATISWRLDYQTGDLDGGAVIAPGRTSVVDFAGAPIEYLGYAVVTNHTPTAPIGVVYAIRSAPEPGVELFGFQSGQQMR